MSEFKVIETQEQLDAIIGERIQRAERKAEEKYADYDEIKAQTETLNQQIADLTSQLKAKDEAITGNNTVIDELKAQIKDHETRSVKTRIAHEVGLPYQLADKLSGEDEDAIREDAKRMAEFIVKPKTPIGGAEPTHEETDPLKSDLATMAHNIKEAFTYGNN